MRCPHCQRENRSAHPTCGHCGRALTRACPLCGHSNGALSRFCASCARPLQTLRAELKYVTVLFADIKNSTALIAGVDPEDADERMGPAVAAMREAVRRHSGSVNRIAGDGLMALFGAPLSREDHALCACLAAQEIVSAVAAHSEGQIAVRVGLHSGNVLLRAIENDFSTDYDAIGDTPHVAHRMEAMAGENQVLMTADTYRLAEGFISARSLGARGVAGLEEPIEIFQLLDASVRQDRWEARAARGLTAFRGRERELGVLREELEIARGGWRRFVEIVGDPGLGKSRLTHELCALARRDEWKVWTAAAQPSDPLNSYRPLARLLHAWLEVGVQPSTEELAAVLDRALANVAPPLEGTSRAALRAVLGLPVEDARWQEIDPPERRSRILAALRELIAAVTRARPHLLLLEDLHWADEETLSVLATVVASVDGKLLIATTRRPSLSARWNRSRTATIELGPLGRDASLEILDRLLGTDASLAELKSILIERAGGNPLFLEESVQSLVDARTLQGERGAYFLEQRIDRYLIPASLYGVVSTRVDRLEPEVKRCVQLAAVVGRQVPLDVLQQLSGEPGDQVLERLSLLDQLGLLLAPERRPCTDGDVAAASGPDAGSAAELRGGHAHFKHALIQEVVYHSLPRREREAIHARVVSVIEALYAGQLGQQLDQLAEHATRGKLWGQAARYRLLLCLEAQNRAGSHEVVQTFEEVIDGIAAMPQEPRVRKAAIDLRLVVANALLPLGEHARLIEVLSEAERLAQSVKDPRRLGTIYNQQSLALWLTGSYEEMRRTSGEAMRVADEIGHPEIGLSALFMCGLARHGLGDYEDALGDLGRVLDGFTGMRESVRHGWSAYPVLIARTFLIDAFLQLGRVREAGVHAEHGWELGDRIGHPYSQALVRSSVVLWMLATEQVKQAVELADATRRLCEQHDLRTMYPTAAARLGAALVAADRLDEALEVLQSALEPDVYGRGAAWTQVDLFRVAAEVTWRRGDAERARDFADTAERLCRTHRAHGQLAHVLVVAARIECALDRRLRALDLAAEALELAEALHMPRVVRASRELQRDGS